MGWIRAALCAGAALACPPAWAGTATISGTIFVDANGNRAKDAAETTGVGSVAVGVYAAGTNCASPGTAVATTTSSAAGAYTLSAPTGPTYQVCVGTSTAYARDSMDGVAGTGFAVPALTASGSPGHLSGFLGGAVSTLVFGDNNNDGVVDGPDTGSPSSTVTLTGTSIAGVAVNMSFATTASGVASFTGVPAANASGYTLQASVPVGLLNGIVTAGATGTASSPGVAPSKITSISLAVQGSYTGSTFAKIPHALIAGFIFTDTNNNGVQDSGENGISGQSITLTGTTDIGTSYGPLVVTTAADGSFFMSLLRPGTYQLDQTSQPAGTANGKNAAGSAGGTPSNPTSTSSRIAGIVLAGSQSSTGNLFGEIPNSNSISGFAYDDYNNDGAQQAAEPAIAGASIALTGTDASGASISLSTTTASDGSFSFAGLLPGTYQLDEASQPPGTVNGKATAGSAGGTASNPTSTSSRIAGIALIGAQSSAGNLFGEIPSTEVVSLVVFSDSNDDGVKTGGENGIINVPITLTGTDVTGAAVSLSLLTSGASGRVNFTNLLPGTYQLDEPGQPAGTVNGKNTVGTAGGAASNPTATSSRIAGIVLPGGSNSLANYFGEVPAANAISGSVFSDSNDDGVQQAGEPGIAGVPIALTGTDVSGASISLSTTTAADGTYSFTGLLPGSYQLDESSQPAGTVNGQTMAGSAGGAASNPTSTSSRVAGIVLAGVQSSTDNLFPEIPAAASISGKAFLDNNDDGLLNGSDAGISGVAIKLTGTDVSGASVSLSATTAADGSFSFGSLLPGTYQLDEPSQPAGTANGKNTPGSAGGAASNPTSTSSRIAGIVLAGAQSSTGNLFGEAPGANSISGTVFSDYNDDGSKQAGEPGIAGVSIALTGTDVAGAAISLTATTAADGSFSFASLLPGTYQLDEGSQPAGTSNGKAAAGSAGGAASNPSSTSSRIAGIALSGVQSSTGNSFGEIPNANAVSGAVFSDANDDGAQQAGEPGIAGVSIGLTGTDVSGAAISLSTTTAADGSFSFSGLLPGTYQLDEASQPAGTANGKNMAGAAGGAPSNPTSTSSRIAGIVLAGVQSSPGNLFGEIPDANAISGFVFSDFNDDGSKQAGEPGLAGVTIALTGSDVSGASISRSASAASDGSFYFPGLLPGTYQLDEGSQPAGTANGKNAVGSAGGTASNPSSTSSRIAGIVLAGVQSSTGNLFGEIPNANAISGTVFSDYNDDGVQQAGEPGIAGVAIALTGTDASGAAIFLSATTAADGSYAFTGLLPGTYQLDEASQPAGTVNGKDTAGTAGGAASNPSATSSRIATIVLAGAQSSTGNLFAEIPAHAITGTVFLDNNDDGALNGPDAGIGGVSIALTGTDVSGAAVSLSTTTSTIAPAGRFAFFGLLPGTYQLDEASQPAGTANGKTAAGTLGGTGSNPTSTSSRIAGIVLPGGQSSHGNVFPEIPAANSISGAVFSDSNDDGIQQAGEPGFAGVSISLTGTDASGATISLSTATAADGTYSFTGLLPGTYQLDEASQPPGTANGKTAAGSAGGTAGNPTSTSSRIAGIVLAGVQSSSANLFPEIPASGSISGKAFLDNNDDGILSGADAGIAGVAINLTGADVSGASVSLSATTDSAGAFSFVGLLPGAYQLDEPSQPGGTANGKSTAGAAGGTASNPTSTSSRIAAIPLAANQAGVGNLFAEIPASGSISGKAFLDNNDDGSLNGADAGIPGVAINLTGTDVSGASVSLSATTDSAGSFSFGSLLPGTYQLDEPSQPASTSNGKNTPGAAGGSSANPTATSSRIAGIVLAGAQNSSGNLFGEIPNANAISGVVFSDSNDDGAKQAGEPGIAGIAIALSGTDVSGATLSLSTTTAADGSFSFAGLLPGAYQLDEASQPAGTANGKNAPGTAGGTASNPTATSSRIAGIALVGAQSSTGNLFGEIPNANSISGAVFSDSNDDGAKQAGEPGIAGVSIALSGTDISSASISLSSATAADGSFSFAGLLPGTYQLDEGSQPAGTANGKNAAGTAGGTATNPTATSSRIAGIALAGAQSSSGNLFGEIPNANVISGTVFSDANDDGAKQAGEPGIAGVAIGLTGTDASGSAISLSATTAADGSFSFGALLPGTYQLDEASQPAGTANGKNTAGTAGGTATNPTATSSRIAGIVLAGAQSSSGNLLGEIPNANSISGAVFSDANDDGSKQAGEPGIPSVSISLTGTDVTGAAISTTSTTAADGSFSFAGLLPGTYQLDEGSQPAGTANGKTAAGTAGGTASNPTAASSRIAGIVLAGSQNSSGNLFGEVPNANVISGTVFSDSNDDGAKQAGEPGISGVPIALNGTDVAGTAVSLSATTAADGTFSFPGLLPGTYQLDENSQPPGTANGKDTPGGAGGAASHPTATSSRIAGIVLAGSQSSPGNLFGEIPNTSIVSGAVFSDFNDDGAKQAGESGLAGVSIALTGADVSGAAISLSAITAADGSFAFPGLLPGTYQLDEALQPAGTANGKTAAGTAGGTASNPTATSSRIAGIVLAGALSSTGNLFGEIPAANAVSGAVFSDSNDDGAKQAGEIGIAGISISLTGTDVSGAAISRSAATAADGSFSFPGLLPGAYQLDEASQPAGTANGKNTTGTAGGIASNPTAASSRIAGISLVGTQSSTGNLFGEIPSANAISGAVFADANDDGFKQAGEPGIAGVAIALSGTDVSGASVSRSTATAADGSFSFGGLLPGTYQLDEPSQPAGTANGKDAAGSAGGAAGNPTATTSRISGIVLSGVQSSIGNLFGEIPAVDAISGTLFSDSNDDGAQQAGEPGIAGTLISLTGTDATGALVALSASTAADGSFSFPALLPGSYQLDEASQPGGTANGKNTAGIAGGTASNPTATSSRIAGINLVGAQSSTGNLFGEIPNANFISGIVFSDSNDDGVQQAGEPGIAGISIALSGTDVSGASVSRSATTAADGSFSFPSLLPGAYQLDEASQPAGTSNGKNMAGAAGGAASNPTATSSRIAGIRLTGVQNSTGNLFGEIPSSSAISGSVFSDFNDDGAKQAGEPGIAGASISLTGTDVSGSSISMAATTAADGSFSFANLLPGTYQLDEASQPAGTANGKNTAGTAGGTPSNPTASSSRIAGIHLAAAQSGAGYLLGEIPNSGSISGTVFLDANNDGSAQAGEPGIPGVAISLIGTDVSGSAVSLSASTAADGSFSFPSLLPGTYQLDEASQPAGTANGKNTAGTAGGGASNPTATSSRISGIVLGPQQAGSGNLFGEVPASASISGKVFADANGDGTQQVGELGIGGASISLTGTDASGASIARSATTAPDGSFAFAGLLPGSYQLDENTQPPGTVNGANTPGAAGGSASNPSATSSRISGIALGAGQNDLGNNFGEIPATGSLSGTVFLDSNGDGIQQAGESGLAGVAISLSGVDVGGSPRAGSATTAADGSFSFAGLAPGLYQIDEPFQPPATLNGKTSAGAAGGTAANPTSTSSRISAIALGAGQAGMGNLFAEIPAAVSISGSAYIDANGDGSRQAGEPPAPGLSISLSGVDSRGAPVARQASTAADGSFSFPGLSAGSYQLDAAAPGVVFGAPAPGSSGGSPSNPTLASARIGSIALAGGQSSTGNMFSQLAANGSIAGKVFADKNNDGSQQPGEKGLPGAQVSLSGSDADGAPVARSAATAADGSFSFGGLLPGTYQLDAPAPQGYVPGKSVPGPAGGVGGSGRISGIKLAGAQAAGGEDFAELALASLSGSVWLEAGAATGSYSAGDPPLAGWTVEVFDPPSMAVIATALTDAAGNYSISSLPPGRDLRVRFRSPSGILLGQPAQGGAAAGVPTPCAASAAQAIASGLASSCEGPDPTISELQVVLAPGANLPAQSDIVEPGGVVYNSATRLPVAGAVVTLSASACPGFDPLSQVINAKSGGYAASAASVSMTTAVDGIFSFRFAPSAPPSCSFILSVAPPNGSLAFPSSRIPAQPGELAPLGGPGAVRLVQSQAGPPTGSDPTDYYLAVRAGSASASILRDNIPLDPTAHLDGELTLSKIGDRSRAQIGETVLFTIMARQNVGATHEQLTIYDTLPRGFSLIRGTAASDGKPFADPASNPLPISGAPGSNGPALSFNLGSIAQGQTRTLTYRARVGAGSSQGDMTNRAQGFACATAGAPAPVSCHAPQAGLGDAPDNLASNVASFKVDVQGGVFGDDACLMGKVFVDCDGDQVQSGMDEVGIPGVRIYLDDGKFAVTDQDGQYSLCGLTPVSRVAKLDEASAPKGSAWMSSSNANYGDARSLLLDLKSGMQHRGDFVEGSCSAEVVAEARRRRAGWGMDGVGKWSAGQLAPAAPVNSPATPKH